MIELRCSRPGGCLCGKPLSGCINAEFVVRPAADPLRLAAEETLKTLQSVLRWYGDGTDYVIPNSMAAELRRIVLELEEGLNHDR